ncbi:MAG TPA: hypothetical protein VG603_14665 [Chitinophagales bacterium]|nr:hypothetical protein [Chitinophagales bacterium]
MKLPFNTVILTYPRSGTHMLQSTLSKHPDIYISNEIFHPRFSSAEIVGGGLNSVLNHWFAKAPDKKVRIAVIHLTHAKPDDVMTQGTDCYKIWNMLYNDTGIKVIMLRRASYLRRYVSHRIAGLNDVFNIYDKRDRPNAKIHIDPLAYFENIMRTDQLYRDTLAGFQDHRLKLWWYEKMVDNFGLTMNEICDFLEVSRMAAQPETILKETRSMKDVIENYDEVMDFFKGHPYATY